MRPCRRPRFLWPFDKQNSVRGRVEPKFIELADIVDSEQVDVPDRRLQFVLRLDDCETRARHLAAMTESRKQTAR